MSDIVDGLRRPAVLLGPLILLLLAERSSHGYELVERLKDLGFPDNSRSQVYKELRRLEAAGFVRSCWEPPLGRGPARRVYEPTSSGCEALARCAESTIDLSHQLQDYRRRVRAVNRRTGATSRPKRAPEAD